MSCIILSAGWLAVLWACAGGNGLRGNGSRAEPERLSLPSAENNGKTHVIEPQLEQCTLEVGRRVLKPIRTVTPWRYEHRIADWRISVDGTIWRLVGSPLACLVAAEVLVRSAKNANRGGVLSRRRL
jgi:hypothetical protein